MAALARMIWRERMSMWPILRDLHWLHFHSESSFVSIAVLVISTAACLSGTAPQYLAVKAA